jgi:hypothetical protein
MGFIPITYEEACELHPKEMKQVLAGFRRSKSKKAKKHTPDTLEWGYQYVEQIGGFGAPLNAADLFSKMAGRQEEREKLQASPVEEQVEEWAGRVVAITLRAKCKGLVGWGAKDSFKEVPEPARRWKRELVKAEVEERAKRAAQPPNELALEILGMIQQLQDQPGFMIVGGERYQRGLEAIEAEKKKRGIKEE